MQLSSLRPIRPFLLVLLSASSCLLAQSHDASTNPSPAAARVDEILSAIHRARSINRVALSPDGKRIAWLLGREIRVAPVDNLASGQRITAATAPDQRCSEGDFIWSPDSASLAFVSDCAQPGEQSDFYLSHLDENPPARLSRLHGGADAPAFSPDGRQIAFLYVEGATRHAGALAAMKAPSGVIGEEGIEIQRVAAIPVDASQPVAPALATPPNLHVYEFDWSPDSQSLAYIAADPPGENNWWVAKLYTQRLFVGASALASETREAMIAEPKIVLSPSDTPGPLHGLQIAVPRWSPDGKSIAFIGGLMSDQGSTGGDVYVIPAAGGQEPINLTDGRHESAAWISWNIPGEIQYSALAGGFSQLRTLVLDSPSTPSVRNNLVDFQFPATVGDGRMELSLSFARGQWAFVKSSFSDPPEIWSASDVAAECVPTAADPNACYEFRQLSHFNDGIKPTWGPVDSLNWTNQSLHIQGWLQLPANYDPSRKYPLIVEVHGGPAAAVPSHWDTGGPFSPAVFSSLGFFVFMPNPRGSYGQGETFTQANRKDFGYGDLRDILAGVDTVLAHYSIDPNRIGLDGWSYGGFMTMFAVSQTHRFRAAVAGAGISDWLSYYGENSIDQWMIPYFGASVYDDPAVYARSSAINFIKNVSTPTLTLVGDRDGECPAPQSFEFWHALRDLRVPTELVVYPDEGHGLSDPSHRRDVLQRTVDWFTRYLTPGS